MASSAARHIRTAGAAGWSRSTPSGIEVIKRLLPELHRTEVSWMAGLSEQEQEQLISYLGRLQADLTPDAAERTWP